MRETTTNPVLRRMGLGSNSGHSRQDHAGDPYGQYAQYNQAGQYGQGQYGQVGTDPYAAPAGHPGAGAPATAHRPMTMDDVLVKSAITLMLVLGGGIAGWMLVDSLEIRQISPVFLGAAALAFVLAMVISFSRKANPALVLTYAVVEGVFLGVGSRLFELQWPGIVVQAVLATVLVAAITLATYKYFNIKVSAKFTRMVIIATMAFAGVVLINFVMSMLGAGPGVFALNGIGLVFAGLGAALAVFNLVIDFDAIEKGVRAGLPQREAWRCAFGLTVTLVWLYWNILRILAILRNN